ncbi:MAG: trypsin-like peptidase domain-containing protein [Gemmatimonadales bacterium]
MKLQLKILTGAKAGHAEVFSKTSVSLGRHPESDLRLDPERDLDVSARHAVIFPDGPHWYVRDSGSRNGTLVNGHKITADTRLDDTDQISLGANGPRIEIRLVPDGTPDGVIEQATGRPEPTERATPAARAPRETVGQVREMSTTQRIRIEVGRQTRKHKTLTVVLSVALIGAAASFFIINQRQAAARAREIAAIQARTDSLLRAAEQSVRALQGQVEGLAGALRQSQDEVTRLQQRLATAQRAGDQSEVEALKRQLADVSQVLRFQQAAALVDFGSISQTNQPAVAMIYVDFGGGDVVSGTAFAVRSDGTMVTNRHVVAGENGTKRPRRMCVQFADSDQCFRARLAGISHEADLAAVTASVRGEVPTVRGLSQRPDTLRQGDPVAIIGFPLGTDLPMSVSERNRPVVKTTFLAGSVSKVLENLIQIDGWGAGGASGSPIFDGNGEVVSILYGGEQGSGGRIVYGVPSTSAIRLLDSLN